MNRKLRRVLKLLIMTSTVAMIGVVSTFIASAVVGDTFTVSMLQHYMVKEMSHRYAKVPIKYSVLNENPNEVEIIQYSSNISSSCDYCADLPNKVINPNNNQSYTVTAIGDSAFKNCDDHFKIDIPDNVETIGNEAFYGCVNLSNINMHNKIKVIGDDAFTKCKNLDKINLPNSVTTIGYAAFYNCSSLTNINIPDSVTTIADCAFYNCSKLSEVTSYTYSPAHIGSDVFVKCPVDIIIPAGTTATDVATGWPKDDLSELIKSVKVIDENGNPIKGAEVEIYINKYTDFALTVGYTNSEGIYTCSQNIPFDTIEVKKSEYQQVKIMYADKFKAVVVMKEIPIFTYKTDEGADITYKITSDKTVEVISGPGRYYQGKVVLPETVQYNGVDYTVTGIAEKAFENCIGITSIVIPDSVIRIEKKAFYGCSSLSEVTSKSETPAKVDSETFVGCPLTIKIYIPAGTKEAYVEADWPETNLVEQS